MPACLMFAAMSWPIADNIPGLTPASIASAQLRERQLHYCNANPWSPPSAAGVPAAELVGQPRFGERHGLSLRAVHAFVRHGDRAGVHGLPNVPPAAHDCGLLHAGSHAEWDAEVTTLGTRFHVVSDDDSGDVAAASAKATSLGQALFTASTSTFGQRPCHDGELTHVGVRQHLRIGALFRQAYAKPLFLGDDGVAAAAQGAVHVQSTSYQRTVVSAAAVVTGLFGAGLGVADDVDGRVPVHVCEEGADCLLFMAKYPKKMCPKSVHNTKSMTMYDEVKYLLPRGVHRRVGQVLDSSLPSMSHFTDNIFTRACHGQGLPCSATDASACITERDAVALLFAADQEFVMRFSRPFSGVFMHPVLDDVRRGLSAAADGSGPRLRVTAAHDTTIAHLLVTLGLPDRRWPPYASRLGFELWRRAEGPQDFVRVLYNGVDVTWHLPCMQRTGHGDVHDAVPLCTLQSFTKQVAELVAPHSSYQEACRE